VNEPGAEPVERRSRMSSLWRKHRARWTLPLVIVAIIAVVAVVDHVDSRRISQVDQPSTPALVQAIGGTSAVDVGGPWSGFNPNTPAGAASSTPTLLGQVLPSAYVIGPNLVPQVNADLLLSVEVTSTSPQTIQYVINPKAVWSDGVPVTADDFIYAWTSQRGDGVDVNGQPDQVASTLGYRDVASVTGSNGGRTVTVVFATPFTDWRVLFDHMVPAHIAQVVGWNTGFDQFNPADDLSAGPFILRSVSTDGTAVLVRNPSWWGTPAVLSSITVSDGQSDASWIAPLASTDDAVSQPGSFTLASLDAVSALPNTQSSIHPSLSMLSLEFDVRSTVGSHVAARQAIAHAIDRNKLLTQVFGSIDPLLVVNQDHLAVAWQPSYAASTAAGEYSAVGLASTEQLLGSLGYTKGPTGLYLDATGKPFTVRMAVEEGDPWIDGTADDIVSQLRAAGISVVAIPVHGAAGLATAASTDSYDMALVTRTANPYESMSEGWYSEETGARGADDDQDWSRFDDPQVDQLFLQASQDLNPVTGGAVYQQIDDQLWDQMVALPLFGEPGLLANGVQVSNVAYNPSVDGVLWNADLWARLKPAPTDSHS
jgi:peptide/nickel transport system substrate-binding protein